MPAKPEIPPAPDQVFLARFVSSMNEVQRYTYGINKANGFWDAIHRTRAALPGDRPVEATLMISRCGLIQTEISEAIEAIRKHPQADWSSLGKDSLTCELAGAVVRIMDLAEDLGLPLAAGILAELERNAGRGHLHGGKQA